MIYTQAAVAVTINSLQTGVASILARLFLKEELNLLMSIGISLIVIGVIIVRRKTVPITLNKKGRYYIFTLLKIG